MEELMGYIVKFSYLLEIFPKIEEVDINPLAVDDGQLLVLDAQIILNKS